MLTLIHPQGRTNSVANPDQPPSISGQPTGSDQTQTYGTNAQYNEQDQLPVHHDPIDFTVVSVPSDHLTPTGPNTYVTDDGETMVFPNLDANPSRSSANPSSNTARMEVARRPAPKKRTRDAVDASVGLNLGR